MPYCRNCGAKIDEDARYCRVCGTPVAPAAIYTKPPEPIPTGKQAQKTDFPLAGIVAIVIVVLLLIALIIAFLPVQPVRFSQSNEASDLNVDSLRLTLNADVASINIMLRDLPENQRAAINVSANGWRSIFGSDKPLALTFNEHRQGSTLEYSVDIMRTAGSASFNTLNVSCDVYVDPSVSIFTTITTSTGAIVMNADTEASFQGIILRTTTGSVVANIKEGVVIEGDFSLETTTGSAELLWNEAKVTGNVPVNVKATTGGLDVNITQNEQIGGNMTLNAETTTGGVNLAMSIKNDIGARISASTGLGGIDVNQQGFSGNQVPIQSNNYPAGNNFDITLRATTGGININVDYAIVGTRS